MKANDVTILLAVALCVRSHSHSPFPRAPPLLPKGALVKAGDFPALTPRPALYCQNQEAAGVVPPVMYGSPFR